MKTVKKKNISDFKNYFKNNPNIKSLIEIREENKIHFENSLNLYSGKFFQKREEIEKKKSKISTHFETNYDEAKKNDYLYQFENYYGNKKGEISEYLVEDEVKQHYNDELNKYIEKFKEFDDQRKTTKSLEEMKEIDKYFTENCPQIYQVANKNDLEKQLNRSGFYGNEHFNNKKKKKLNNYEEALNQYKWNITEFITNKYNDAFSSSEDEKQFRNYYGKNNSEIRIYIDINEDLKKHYRNKINEQLEIFKEDLNRYKTSIINFINSKYNEAKKLSNSEQEFRNYFCYGNSDIAIYLNKNESLKQFFNNKVDEKVEIFKNDLSDKIEKKTKEEIDNMFNSPQYEEIFDQSRNKEHLKRIIDEKGNRFREINYFENKKQEKLNQFDDEVEKMKSNIITHFSNYKKESLNKSNETDFTNFFNSKKNEVQKFLTKDLILNFYMNKFYELKNEFMEKQIDKYFNEQYPKLYEVQNKTDLENKLNNSGFNNQYFNNKKNEKLNNYVK